MSTFLELFNCDSECLIDADQLEKILSRKWRRSVQGYVETTGRPKRSLHRFILDLPQGREPVVDHINGNPLDNRKANLRICSQKENSWNRKKSKSNKTGFKGVTHHRNLFRASIGSVGKTYLGLYECIEDAAMAYDKAAVEKYGEFARTNFPIEKVLSSPAPRIAKRAEYLRKRKFKYKYGYPGVSFCNTRNQFRAFYTSPLTNKKHSLTGFLTPLEAFEAREMVLSALNEKMQSQNVA